MTPIGMQMTDEQPRAHLWTVKEVSAYWRVSDETVYRLIRQKKIMFIPVYGGYRIPHEQVMSGIPRVVDVG